MKTDLRSRSWVPVPLAVVVAMVALAGCAPSRVQVVSFQDPYFPERYPIELEEAFYDLGPTGDLYIVARHIGPGEHGATHHYLNLHVFWPPRPGKTPAESSTTDAVVQYVVATELGAAVYEGTGFVYGPVERQGTLELDLESSQLRLTSRTGNMPDVLGPARLTGKLIAKHDEPLAADRQREAELVANLVGR
jgi:hypothetical protein